MTESLPLLIATDQNLVFAAATMLRSTHAALAEGFELDAYVYVHGVPDEELERFRRFCESEFGRAPRLIDDRSFDQEQQHLMDELGAALPRFPRPLWARLFLPSLVTGSERAVFADIDVAVVKDLSPLWRLPLNGHTVGAVHDLVPGAERQLRQRYSQMQRYFNAGVMAIEVPAWKSQRIGERAAEWVLGVGRKSYFPDQDALNVVLMDDDGAPRWQQLDPIWNSIGFGEVEWAEGPARAVPPEEVRLRHFAGPSKPWNTGGLLFKEVFDEHLAAVPFEVPLHLRTRARPTLLRRLVRRARRALRSR